MTPITALIDVLCSATPRAPAGIAALAATWRQWITRIMAMARDRSATRRSRRELSSMSDHELHDLGLSRPDVLAEIDNLWSRD